MQATQAAAKRVLHFHHLFAIVIMIKILINLVSEKHEMSWIDRKPQLEVAKVVLHFLNVLKIKCYLLQKIF